MPRRRPETWGRSTVRTACPLDCPDSCTLDVTVEKGRVVKIDGGDANPVTRNYICAKVRRFARARLRRGPAALPGGPQGPERSGRRSRASPGTKRSTTSPTRMQEIRDRHSAEAILPFCYGGSNGLLTQDTNDAVLFRGFGTSRLARTVCAAPTGAANQALYGKMPGVTYAGLRPRAADRAVGRQPVARRAFIWSRSCKRGARGRRQAGRRSIRGRPRSRGRRTCTSRRSPGTDLPIALALHRHPVRRRVRRRAFPRRAHARRRRVARARGRMDVRAGRRGRRRRRPRRSQQLAAAVRDASSRRWCAAAGGSSATATAAAPRRRSWRCRRSAASSASAAAASR